MSALFYTPENNHDSIEISLLAGESVLEALLRSGFSIPNGCRAGACQSCMMQSDAPEIPSKAQTGLKSAQKLAGYFLSCSCFPEQDFNVRHGEVIKPKITATVVEKTLLNKQVFRLRLSAKLDYLPGQYVTLWKDSTTARCYSLASVPGNDNTLEFHIKRLSDGAFSQWAFEHLEVGHDIEIQGPLGECCYLPESHGKPLLLCGVGTGLAPLYGIVCDALQKGHQQPITLVLGGRNHEHFYLVDELVQLSHKYPNLSVVLVSQEGKYPNTTNNPLDTVNGDIYTEIKTRFANLKDTQVFLCGAENFVRKMKKTCFLQGAAMADIHADAFVAFKV